MTMATAIELQHRFVPIEAPKEQADTLEFSFSSEEPVRRYFGDEVLDHSEESVDLARLNSGVAPLLFNHDPSLVLALFKEHGCMIVKLEHIFDGLKILNRKR